MDLLRTQTVTITPLSVASPAEAGEVNPLTRRQRAHWRMSWAERLARNACSPPMQQATIHLFGIPTAFATSLGLAVA